MGRPGLPRQLSETGLIRPQQPGHAMTPPSVATRQSVSFPSAATNPASVAHFIGICLGFPELSKQMEDDQIDGEALYLLEVADFVAYGLRKGPALKLHRLLQQNKHHVHDDLELHSDTHMQFYASSSVTVTPRLANGHCQKSGNSWESQVSDDEVLDSEPESPVSHVTRWPTSTAASRMCLESASPRGFDDLRKAWLLHQSRCSNSPDVQQNPRAFLAVWLLQQSGCPVSIIEALRAWMLAPDLPATSSNEVVLRRRSVPGNLERRESKEALPMIKSFSLGEQLADTDNFQVGQRVCCRDGDQEDWRPGVVEKLEPLKIRPDGWEKACGWKEVCPGFEVCPGIDDDDDDLAESTSTEIINEAGDVIDGSEEPQDGQQRLIGVWECPGGAIHIEWPTLGEDPHATGQSCKGVITWLGAPADDAVSVSIARA